MGSEMCIRDRAKSGQILALRVLALAEQRGPAPQARKLYEIVAD